MTTNPTETMTLKEAVKVVKDMVEEKYIQSHVLKNSEKKALSILIASAESKEGTTKQHRLPFT